MATIPYANVIDRKALPVDAQDVVTEARLVVAGEYQGDPTYREATQLTSGGGVVSWGDVYPWPVVHARIPDAGANATYRAQRAFKLPEGLNPFKAAGSDSVGVDNINSSLNLSNVANSYDGDQDTFASNTADGITTLDLIYRDDVGFATTIPRAYGVYLRYEYVTDTPLSTDRLQVRMGAIMDNPPRDNTDAEAYYEARLVTTESPQGMYMVTPFDARIADVNLVDLSEKSGLITRIQVNANPSGVGAVLRIYEVHGLVLDTDTLDGVADAQVRIPFSSPKQVTVDYHVPLEDEHTITGWPGGDLVASVARQTFVGGTTVIEFEQARRSSTVSLIERNQAEALRRATLSLTLGSRR